MEKILGFYQGNTWCELHASPKGYMYQDGNGTKAYFLNMPDALEFFHTRIDN